MKTKFNINISEHLHAHTLNTKTNRCTCGHSVRKKRGFLTHLLEELDESTPGFRRALSNAYDEGYQTGFDDGHMT